MKFIEGKPFWLVSDVIRDSLKYLEQPDRYDRMIGFAKSNGIASEYVDLNGVIELVELISDYFLVASKHRDYLLESVRRQAFSVALSGKEIEGVGLSKTRNSEELNTLELRVYDRKLRQHSTVTIICSEIDVE